MHPTARSYRGSTRFSIIVSIYLRHRRARLLPVDESGDSAATKLLISLGMLVDKHSVRAQVMTTDRKARRVGQPLLLAVPMLAPPPWARSPAIAQVALSQVPTANDLVLALIASLVAVGLIVAGLIWMVAGGLAVRSKARSRAIARTRSRSWTGSIPSRNGSSCCRPKTLISSLP